MQKHHPLSNNDPRVIVMDRGNYTSCTVILRGAWITSWKIEHEEQIFISRVSCLDDYNKFRGGVSLVFPHFDIWDFGRDHGFARDVMWSLKSGPITNKNGDVYLELYLSSNCFTRSSWNYDFEIRYSILLKPMQLETKIAIINPSPYSSFEFHFEQHWYMKVEDIRTIDFIGLDGLAYVDDKIMASKSIFKEKVFRPTGELLRTFEDSPRVITIINKNEDKIVKITKENLPDFNLWNPWETACRVPNLGNSDANTVEFLQLDPHITHI